MGLNVIEISGRAKTTYKMFYTKIHDINWVFLNFGGADAFQHLAPGSSSVSLVECKILSFTENSAFLFLVNQRNVKNLNKSVFAFDGV